MYFPFDSRLNLVVPGSFASDAFAFGTLVWESDWPLCLGASCTPPIRAGLCLPIMTSLDFQVPLPWITSSGPWKEYKRHRRWPGTCLSPVSKVWPLLPGSPKPESPHSSVKHLLLKVRSKLRCLVPQCPWQLSDTGERFNAYGHGTSP